jgi:hypothetical protein
LGRELLRTVHTPFGGRRTALKKRTYAIDIKPVPHWRRTGAPRCPWHFVSANASARNCAGWGVSHEAMGLQANLHGGPTRGLAKAAAARQF